MNRRFTLQDRLIGHADNMLRTLAGNTQAARPSPAIKNGQNRLTPSEVRQSVRLMRVNHTGEVCAQALYQGQSLTAHTDDLWGVFQQAAQEENDHLAWCEEQLDALNGKTSKLNLLFYSGSFAIGAAVGLMGDRVSAAFLAETEYQVADHLDRHLKRLPAQDQDSRSILMQMREDELKHATSAEQAGSAPLPKAAKGLMRTASKLMTGLSYWV